MAEKLDLLIDKQMIKTGAD